MELLITRFFREAAPQDYSASRMELGQDAGQITWNHAVEDSPEYMLLDTEEKRDAFRSFVASSGGWTEAEIAKWSDTELNALLLQWIAGDIRETPGMTLETWNWEKYQKLAEQGIVAGRLFPGSDGEIYFDIGS